ncbi:FAD-binding oxidoreductase [Roseovarius aestuarii]|nr:FAD-binding oxidoreductase [Roseovarius aestuarii]
MVARTISGQGISQTDAALPTETDVVVIGGGIVGVSAAWHLANRGFRTVLCEKGDIGGEQSGRNWGLCRNTMRSPAEIPLMRQSMQDWRDASVFGGLDTGFRTTGIMYFTGRSSGDAASYEAWLQSIRNSGLDSRMVSAQEISQLLPGCAEVPTSGALYTASDAVAEPAKAAPAIARAAQAQGAIIRTRCAVRGIERSGGGLHSVVTEAGTIKCGAALLAGGAWSRLFAGNLGLNLPALNVMGSVMRTEPMSGGPDISMVGRNFGCRKREDGGYIVSQADATIFDIVPDSFRLFNAFRPMIGTGLRQLRMRVGSAFFQELMMQRKWQLHQVTPFEQTRILDPKPSQRVLQQAAGRVAQAFPFFKDLKVAQSWGGMIDVTPDALPIIGPVQQVPGLFMATGFSGHGFGLGPGGGRLGADLLAGGAPVVDPHPYRPQRFQL